MKAKKFVVVTALALLASVSVGCGGKLASVPPLPAVVEKVDQDVKAGAVKALGILGASGQVLDRISAIEAELFASGSIPPAVHAQITSALNRVASAGLTAIGKIESGAVVQWADLKAVVDPVVASINPLVELLKTAGPTARERLLVWSQVALELVQKIAVATKPSALEVTQ